MQPASYCNAKNAASVIKLPYNSNIQICGNGAFTHVQSGVCAGDSGGPLMDNDVVVGITSRKMAWFCATKFPDVFTKVGAYATWIDSVLKNN